MFSNSLASSQSSQRFWSKILKMQVEAAQHLHQPLVHQRFRHHDQHAFGTFSKNLVMQNQTGFDGFTQTNLIGQQHPRRITVGDFVRDI